MKTNYMIKTAAALAVSGLVWSGSTVPAQPAADMASPAPAVSTPTLANGVPPILQLAQAKVSDGTIIAFIRNSGTSYSLNADQIIYLRKQGVSEAVVTAMLNQPQPGVAAAAPQPAGTTITSANGSTATVAPTATYVQPAPATTYYYTEPYYYPAYPAYGYGYPYPAVSIGLGWGWGGGWHGGGYGGWHGGGGHGGWHH